MTSTHKRPIQLVGIIKFKKGYISQDIEERLEEDTITGHATRAHNMETRQEEVTGKEGV